MISSQWQYTPTSVGRFCIAEPLSSKVRFFTWLRTATVNLQHNYQPIGDGPVREAQYLGTVLSGSFEAMRGDAPAVQRGDIGRIEIFDNQKRSYQSTLVVIEAAEKNGRFCSFTNDPKKVYEILGVSKIEEPPDFEASVVNEEADVPIIR